MSISVSADFPLPAFRFTVVPGPSADRASATIDYVFQDEVSTIGDIEWEELDEPAPAAVVMWDDEDAIAALPKDIRDAIVETSADLRAQVESA